MTGTEPVSIRYTHAKNAYDKMHEKATRKRTDEGDEILVWEGFFTRLIKDDLNLATPMYTDIRTILGKDGMGCIRQLRRGGSSTPSQWELVREPTEELWKSLQERKPRSKKAIHEQQLVDMNRRLTAIEDVLRAGGISIQ